MKTVVCGGNPLENCPQNWDEANALIEKANENKKDYQARWAFDCGYKLDFDGGIVSIASRFYPPKEHYGSTWDGKAKVYIKGKCVCEKSFDCATFEKLTSQVEKFYSEIEDKCLSIFNL